MLRILSLLREPAVSAAAARCCERAFACAFVRERVRSHRVRVLGCACMRDWACLASCGGVNARASGWMERGGVGRGGVYGECGQPCARVRACVSAAVFECERAPACVFIRMCFVRAVVSSLDVCVCAHGSISRKIIFMGGSVLHT
eukprot:2709711-Pleurochrysis_carterae.AAC.1